MQIWAETGKSALPIHNYSQILYQFLTFTQNLKRSHKNNLILFLFCVFEWEYKLCLASTEFILPHKFYYGNSHTLSYNFINSLRNDESIFSRAYLKIVLLNILTLSLKYFSMSSGYVKYVYFNSHPNPF